MTEQLLTRCVCGDRATRVVHCPATQLGGIEGWLVACVNPTCHYRTEPYSTQMEAENAWEILQRQERRARLRVVK